MPVKLNARAFHVNIIIHGPLSCTNPPPKTAVVNGVLIGRKDMGLCENLTRGTH